MFTIKHIDELGTEHLWNADKPSFSNGVFTSEQDGETLWTKGGTIYVMNDKGSTVASYHLVTPDVAKSALFQASFNQAR